VGRSGGVGRSAPSLYSLDEMDAADREWRRWPLAAGARFPQYLSLAIGNLLFSYWNRSFTSLLAALKVEAASAPFK
jgi:hypothetical protein